RHARSVQLFRNDLFEIAAHAEAGGLAVVLKPLIGDALDRDAPAGLSLGHAVLPSPGGSCSPASTSSALRTQGPFHTALVCACCAEADRARLRHRSIENHWRNRATGGSGLNGE